MSAARRAVVLTALLTLLAGCATAPETGRSQLILVSSEQAAQLGVSQFNEIKAKTPISQDPEQKALVERVGRRVAAVVDLPDAKWEFVLFDQPDTPNAFALPGGKVGVFSGILPITQDEAGLAAVIGHEVAHVTARHGSERLSQGLLFQLGGQVLETALQTQPGATQQLAMAAYGIGGQIGVLLPYSRKHELEADHIGVLYMARAGYDPRKAIEFWQRFGDYSRQRGQPPEFLSTHPLDETRIKRLQEVMPEALQEHRAAGGR